ncbi:MAG: M28 family peptidase [Clostridia bacterium]|nr:M28 family peptidase [Clostridia bacterium]
MTQNSKVLLEKFQVRKSAKQKSRFREYLKEEANNLGYEYKEEGSFLAHNVVIGNLKTAKVIYTAHYDTCAVLPFPNFITPKNFFIYILYQILLSFALLIIPITGATLTYIVPAFVYEENDEVRTSFLMATMIVFIVLLVLEALWMLGFGKANKHTANDNTSGVATLLDIMSSLPQEQKERVAFVFFDLEEAGLIGSMCFRYKHKMETNDKLLVNFDCVSDGENIIFVIKGKSKKYFSQLEKAFQSTDKVKVELNTSGAFYPSDQSNFPCGIGVAALKKSKKLGILYMDRIHTPKDTVFREENLEYLTDGAIKLVSQLTNQ